MTGSSKSRVEESEGREVAAKAGIETIKGGDNHTQTKVNKGMNIKGTNKTTKRNRRGEGKGHTRTISKKMRKIRVIAGAEVEAKVGELKLKDKDKDRDRDKGGEQ